MWHYCIRTVREYHSLLAAERNIYLPTGWQYDSNDDDECIMIHVSYDDDVVLPALLSDVLGLRV